MDKSVKELHDLLEQSLLLLRTYLNNHHQDIPDSQLLALCSTINEIERSV